MYKTKEELESVIALGKPQGVVDMFLESYLQGEEYKLWAEGKDLESDVYDEVDMSAKIAQWKLDNYAMLRKPLYPDMSIYIDAVVKADTLGKQAYIDKCLAVKAMYPKEVV